MKKDKADFTNILKRLVHEELDLNELDDIPKSTKRSLPPGFEYGDNVMDSGDVIGNNKKFPKANYTSDSELRIPDQLASADEDELEELEDEVFEAVASDDPRLLPRNSTITDEQRTKIQTHGEELIKDILQAKIGSQENAKLALMFQRLPNPPRRNKKTGKIRHYNDPTEETLRQVSEVMRDFILSTRAASKLDDTDIYDIAVDLKKALKKLWQKEAEGKERAEKLAKIIHNGTFFSALLDGRVVDYQQLKNTLTVRPAELLSENAKIKHSGMNYGRFFELTLPAFQGIYYDEYDKAFKIASTCPLAGECTSWCFAAAGGYVQYEGVALKQARMLNYLMNDWNGYKTQLISEINAYVKTSNNPTHVQDPEKEQKYRKTVYVRWHDSGDFFNSTYLEMAYNIARETPNVIHYAYTKSISMVRNMKVAKPDNFILNYSEGGKESETRIGGRNNISNTDKQAIMLPKSLLSQALDGKFKNTNGYIEDLKEADSKDGRYTQAMNDLKDIVYDNYGGGGTNFTRDQLFTYTELGQTPYRHRAHSVNNSGRTKRENLEDELGYKTNPKPDWVQPEERTLETAKHAIIMAGDGDDAATRPDVGITFLLEH